MNLEEYNLVSSVFSFVFDINFEANFGDSKAHPFKYDVKKCPAIGLQ
jgi:hypothetical protein